MVGPSESAKTLVAKSPDASRDMQQPAQFTSYADLQALPGFHSQYYPYGPALFNGSAPVRDMYASTAAPADPGDRAGESAYSGYTTEQLRDESILAFADSARTADLTPAEARYYPPLDLSKMPAIAPSPAELVGPGFDLAQAPAAYAYAPAKKRSWRYAHGDTLEQGEMSYVLSSADADQALPKLDSYNDYCDDYMEDLNFALNHDRKRWSPAFADPRHTKSAKRLASPAAPYCLAPEAPSTDRAEDSPASSSAANADEPSSATSPDSGQHFISKEFYAPLPAKQIPPPELNLHFNNKDDAPRRQKPRFEEDLYTPTWVRQRGDLKEGWCSLCPEPRWLVLKNSAYWYDKNFAHGINPISGMRYDKPLRCRRIEGSKELFEGLCGVCDKWVQVTTKRSGGGTSWFRHASKCHKSKEGAHGGPAS